MGAFNEQAAGLSLGHGGDSTGSKQSIARGFGGASSTYEKAARLQRRMGRVMLDTLPEEWGPRHILDLGCGTGWFSRRLQAQYPQSQLTGVDLSQAMIARAVDADQGCARWLTADAEQLPLADNSVDLVFSNLMIQWSHHPARVLEECRRVLKPGGRLLLSTLLDGTLVELQWAWSQADPGRPHINRFAPEQDWRALGASVLPGATLETETIVLPYESPMALNRELQYLGAVFRGQQRRRSVTAPGRFRSMCRAYPAAEGGGCRASYVAGWTYWVKP